MMTISATTFAAGKVEKKAFEFNLNATNIVRSLDLTADQYEKVIAGNETFLYETRTATYKKDENAQKKSFDKALHRNVKYMKTVLNKEQYRKYLMLLNLTLNNRGLNN